MFEVIQGDAGFVTVAGGAKAGIINKWNVRRQGLKPDGTPRLVFKAQFSYANDVLMTMKGMKKRVVVSMVTKYGREDVDILDWDEARFEGNVLTLENVLYTQTKLIK